MPDTFLQTQIGRTHTEAEVAQLNADIAAGRAFYVPGSSFRLGGASASHGTLYTLRGVGRAAQFLPTSTVTALAATAAPVATSRPVVIGSWYVGSILSASTGLWDNTPVSYTYQWKTEDGVDIAGATSSTYQLAVGQLLRKPYVVVTATNANGSGVNTSFSGATVLPGPPLTTGIVVANRLAAPDIEASGNIPTLRVYQKEFYSHAAGAISNLRLTYVYWYLSSVFVPTDITGTPTIDWRIWLEYPRGTFTQVLFTGAAPCTLSTTSRQVTSDAVPITIPANTRFWVHTLHASAASRVPVCALPASSGILGTNDGYYTAPDNATPVSTPSPAAGASTLGPSLITGDVASANAKAELIIGDSIAHGQLDATSTGGRGGSGWVARLMDKLSASYVKIARPTSYLSHHATVCAGNAQMIAFLNVVKPAVTGVLSQGGINDIANARSQAQILADCTSLLGTLSGNGRLLRQSTITTRVDTTDGYTSVANQTQKTDGNMAAWSAINDAIRATASGSRTIIDAANACANTPGGTVFRYPPVMTTDGTHVTSEGADLVAAALTLTQ